MNNKLHGELAKGTRVLEGVLRTAAEPAASVDLRVASRCGSPSRAPVPFPRLLRGAAHCELSSRLSDFSFSPIYYSSKF